MHSRITIAGHGLAGCVLALSLYRRKIPFRLVGYSMPGEASFASSGLIAPVTGRRYVKAWRINEFISSALEFYRWTESFLDAAYFFPVDIIRFLSNSEALQAWSKRLEDPEYSQYISGRRFPFVDELSRPYGVLSGGYRLDTPGWLEAVHQFLQAEQLLDIVDASYKLQMVEDHPVIWATGAVDPFFMSGIIPNKGEALEVYMPEWRMPVIIKDEVFIVPLDDQDRYWIGSYYQPWPEDPNPSAEGKKQLLASVRKLHAGPIEIIHHLAGIRPTVDDRRPLIGAFPGYPGHYLFNGMGTKGTSLAPFWAEQLIRHITEQVPLPVEISPARYI